MPYNRKLLGTSATLVVTGALLVVTRRDDPRCHIIDQLGEVPHERQIDGLVRHPCLDQAIGCLSGSGGLFLKH